MFIAKYSGVYYGPFVTILEAQERMKLSSKEPSAAVYSELREAVALPPIHPGQITVHGFLSNIEENVDKIRDHIDPSTTRNSGRTRGTD